MHHRQRFASPRHRQGALHIGGARTALYNWLIARGSGGSLVLRIEDTDRERSTEENVEQILEALRWLELDWDEGPLSQADRADRHRERIEELLAAGKAYRDPAGSAEVKAYKQAHDNAGYRGTPSGAEGAAVRLRVPDDGEIVVHDAIRGEVTFENRIQDDLVIARGDGSPVYNFAVAVDDADMGITHVVRGDDHLSNTPKQLYVLDALGEQHPVYAHLPLLHGPDGKKLSKRHGAASVQELRDGGYLPAATRNYLALLGWGTTDDATLLSTGELVARFAIEQVGRSAAIFDEQKLRWMNGRFMRELVLSEYERSLAQYLHHTDSAAEGAFLAASPELRRGACEIVQEKAQTMAEVWGLIAFLFVEPERDPAAWEKVMVPEAVPLLELAGERLRVAETFDPEGVEIALRGVLEQSDAKPKALFQPLRVAISGTTISPGIFESVSVLGRDSTLERIDAALAALG